MFHYFHFEYANEVPNLSKEFIWPSFPAICVFLSLSVREKLPETVNKVF